MGWFFLHLEEASIASTVRVAQSAPAVEEEGSQSQRGEQHREGGGTPAGSPRGPHGRVVAVVSGRVVSRLGHLKHI